MRTVPDSNAVRVFPAVITLEFSKYVNRGSVQKSVFISPYLGELGFDWSGTEVNITFREKLRKNTTYVLNLGTDVADIREATRMAAGFALAFSTGDSIDRGLITGSVFDEKPEGVMIYAYRLAGMSIDTLDPRHTKPDYITQTGKNGAFALSHLAYGPYRVLALRDEYRNLLYDRQIDEYGAPPGDCQLDSVHQRIDGLWYRLAREDTVRPFLAGLRTRDRFRIQARFSEALDSASFTHAWFQILDTLSMQEVPIRLIYQDRVQRAIAGIITAAPLDSPAVYRFRVRGVADLAGNTIDTAFRGEIFNGTLAADTVRPKITVRDMRDSVRGVALGAALEILFSDPPVPFAPESAVGLFDSLKRRVDVLVSWSGPSSIALLSRAPLASKAWYAIRVRMDSVRSLMGRGYRDSTYSLRFQTLDLRTTGSIAGTVVDERGGKGAVVVTAMSIDRTPRTSSTLSIKDPGPFTFTQLPEGKYVISGFRDLQGDGKYFFGLPVPFKPAERFAVYPDTIRVRARWGVEGVLLKFN